MKTLFTALVLLSLASALTLALSLRYVCASKRLAFRSKGALLGALFAFHAALFSGIATFWGLPAWLYLGMYLPAGITYMGGGSLLNLLPNISQAAGQGILITAFLLGVVTQILLGALLGFLITLALKMRPTKRLCHGLR